LTPSPALAAVIAMAHLVAAGALLTVLTGWAGLSAAGLAAMLGAAAAWDRALLRASSSPKAIELYPDGMAKCLFANGESAFLERAAGGAVTRYWVALRLRARHRRSLFVVGGMLVPAEIRILRLWALWGRLPGAALRQTAEEGL
jgi:hypothetical protein